MLIVLLLYAIQSTFNGFLPLPMLSSWQRAWRTDDRSSRIGLLPECVSTISPNKFSEKNKYSGRLLIEHGFSLCTRRRNLCLMMLSLHSLLRYLFAAFVIFSLSPFFFLHSSLGLVPISYLISASRYYTSSTNSVPCTPLLNANLAGICLELSKSFDKDASLLTVNRLHLLDVNQQLYIEAALAKTL